MILMWLFGDLYKVSYYTQKDSPLQLVLGGIFSCTVDLTILSQFWIYRRGTDEECAKNIGVTSIDTESHTMTTNVSETSDVELSVVIEKNIEIEDKDSKFVNEKDEISPRLRRNSGSSPAAAVPVRGAVSPVEECKEKSPIKHQY